MEFHEAYHVYSTTTTCSSQRTEAFCDMIHFIAKVMSSTNHTHEAILLFWKTFGISLIVGKFNGCIECANILVQHRHAQLEPTLRKWKNGRRCYYPYSKHLHILLQVYREQTLLPILVGIRTITPNSILHTITKHPLYTKDIWRAVFRLAE
jgi:hypothetical protein